MVEFRNRLYTNTLASWVIVVDAATKSYIQWYTLNRIISDQGTSLVWSGYSATEVLYLVYLAYGSRIQITVADNQQLLLPTSTQESSGVC